jgi:peptidoglycan/xylan/chitin deacetylase (PgdA/CDA1 family)
MPLAAMPLIVGAVYVAGRTGAETRDSIPRDPLPAPAVAMSPSERARWRPLPPYRAVPVLLYHGINDRTDVYSVSQRQFARHMALLDAAGFRTISAEQYVRYLRGDRPDLPPRPILITFDDGRLDSYRGADAVLRRYGFRAVMFVIAGAVDRAPRYYASWDDLQRMAGSGRWDVQEHAGAGHVRIVRGPHGEKGPFYAYRRFSGGRLESLGEWRSRVTEDIDLGRRLLEQNVPGFRPLLFALPYGDYGQLGTNDPRIPRLLMRWLSRRFTGVFLAESSMGPSGRGSADPQGALGRIEVHTDTTPDALYRELWRVAGSRHRTALTSPVSRGNRR